MTPSDVVSVCVLSAVASIQRLPAVSVMTDINFPMKGRKGMVDWARNSEDKVVVPKTLFVSQSAGIWNTCLPLCVSLFECRSWSRRSDSEENKYLDVPTEPESMSANLKKQNFHPDTSVFCRRAGFRKWNQTFVRSRFARRCSFCHCFSVDSALWASYRRVPGWRISAQSQTIWLIDIICLIWSISENTMKHRLWICVLGQRQKLVCGCDLIPWSVSTLIHLCVDMEGSPVFILGTVLYKTLGLMLPAPK